MQWAYRCLFALCLITSPLGVSDAFAKAKAPKKKIGKVVLESDILKATFKVKSGKKTSSYKGYCLGKVPGQAKRRADGKYTFTSYSALVKSLRKTQGRSPKISLYQSLAKSGAKVCANPPYPDYLSLKPYRGTFGEVEARILYDRFAFGGSPENITDAVNRGLASSVNLLTSRIEEPGIDAVEAELRCDGRLANDPDNEQCDPGNPNDLYTPGFRYGIYYRILHTDRPFFEKLFQFIHDERMAASTTAVGGCEAYALKDHVAMIRRAAQSGDYIQFMRDYNSDVLGHLKWLDGASNKRQGPNENYAREFWELGTTGPSDLSGNAVYSDRDIAMSALAFTGWTMQGYRIGENWVCLPVYVPGFHDGASHVIFEGTPYRAEVSDAEGVLQATFRHPRTAESLAQDIWKEFINPFPTPQAIRELAALIRTNNYNLVTTLRQVMMSEAVYAPKSRKSLIKHPMEKLLGFLRTSGIPVDYMTIDWLLSELNQRPLLPDTVFGWDEKRLSGEMFLLEWRNVSLWLLMQDKDDWKTEYGYDVHQRFLATLPSNSQPSDELITRLSSWLGVSVTSSQRERMAQYLNFDLRRCYNNSGACAGQQYELRRNIYDPYPTSSNWEYKLRGALALLVNLPDYGVK